MNKKVLVCALSAVLVLGGAIAVTASKNDTQPDDKYTAVTVNTESLTQKKEGQEVELETEHGVTFYKIESDDDFRDDDNYDDKDDNDGYDE